MTYSLIHVPPTALVPGDRVCAVRDDGDDGVAALAELSAEVVQVSSVNFPAEAVFVRMADTTIWQLPLHQTCSVARCYQRAAA